jgi:hypothetical protein
MTFVDSAMVGTSTRVRVRGRSFQARRLLCGISHGIIVCMVGEGIHGPIFQAFWRHARGGRRWGNAGPDITLLIIHSIIPRSTRGSRSLHLTPFTGPLLIVAARVIRVWYLAFRDMQERDRDGVMERPLSEIRSWLALQLVRVWGSRRSYLRSFIGLSLVLMVKVIRVLGRFFGDTPVVEHGRGT